MLFIASYDQEQDAVDVIQTRNARDHGPTNSIGTCGLARLFLLILDSFGIGNAPDAKDFGDQGANTLLHIADHRPLNLPFMEQLGLGNVSQLANGECPRGIMPQDHPKGLYGAANEISKGKDTPSGHWEIAGQPVMFDWSYFPKTIPTFPNDLIAAVCDAFQWDGVLANCHGSGTDIIRQFGNEHIQTGQPIFYTSSDSVLQIAAHEDHFGLETLDRLCVFVRHKLDQSGLKIGRVIARPFIGASKQDFTRTGNRRDYSVLPPAPTLLNLAQDAKRAVIGIGKIADIYAHQGITRVQKAHGNMALFDETLKAADDAPDGSLIMTNFVDFDMIYGHRRDIEGYGHALEAFDRRLPELEHRLRDGDLVIITADHGCDPSWPGTDHTRERVPILGFGPNIASKPIGIRHSFSDIGASACHHLGLTTTQYGDSFL